MYLVQGLQIANLLSNHCINVLLRCIQFIRKFCFASSVMVILPRFPNVNHPLSRGIQAGRFDRRLRGGGGGVNNTHSCSWRNPCRE